MATFVRGSNQNIEYKRNDQDFYRGIVIKNWDPQRLYRVKVYIPELSNQPLEDWLQEYEQMDMRFPGTNNTQDVWKDVDLFEEMSKFIPWAEACFPLLGENSPGRYNSPAGLAMTSDSNYPSAQQKNNTSPVTKAGGGWGPSFLWENLETNTGDAFTSPVPAYSVNNNPYSFQYRPANQVDKPKGVYGAPSVGSQVWVFHYRGDPNFPVYIGGRHSYRENCLLTDADASKEQQSQDYPGVMENFPKKN
tara:strand:+ start:83 stop:826 length:744 start_codon:yes stop_codon:yes gene_type:complete